jgi:hypothetical protein
MAALGLIASLDAVHDLIQIEHRHEPQRSNERVYGELSDVFLGLYDKLAPDFHALGRTQDARST